MEIGQKMSELKFKLIDEKTGEELELPFKRRTWDGKEIWVHKWQASRFIGNPGYCFDQLGYAMLPSVVGAKIVEVV